MEGLPFNSSMISFHILAVRKIDTYIAKTMLTCWVSLFCNGFTTWANGTGHTSTWYIYYRQCCTKTLSCVSSWSIPQFYYCIILSCMCLIQWYGWKVICIHLLKKIMDVKGCSLCPVNGLDGSHHPLLKIAFTTLMFWRFLTTSDL